jgi:stearoyl-CoA desaturase (delta-9 desaturase)
MTAGRHLMQMTPPPSAAERRAPDRVDWVKSIPFLAVHAVAIATPFVTPFAWRWAALAAASYAIRIFGITAGYHRYFSHRSYRTSRPVQLALAVLGCASAQKGPLWWAGNHREHHRWSDTPRDVHSPVQHGFWWSHVGWILSRRHDATPLHRVPDLARFPELRWLDRWHLVPVVAYAGGLFLAFGLPGLTWGFFVATVLTWHGTFLVNSLAHVIGRRRYDTADASRNSALIAAITLGEGWHNNHHHHPSTANQGWFWWEVDVTYCALRALAAAGLVRDLRLPPAAIRDAHLALAGGVAAAPRLHSGRRAAAAGGVDDGRDVGAVPRPAL